MNLLTKLFLLVLLAVVAVFVLLHVLPYLLGCLALFGGYKLYHALRDRTPPTRWP